MKECFCHPEYSSCFSPERTPFLMRLLQKKFFIKDLTMTVFGFEEPFSCKK